jgi:hypothetical protein
MARCHKGMRIASNAKKNGQTFKANHKQQEHDRTDTKPNGGGSSPSRIVATYNYVDESGETLFEVVRFDARSRNTVNGLGVVYV